jgi:hypothetical protein
MALRFIAIAIPTPRITEIAKPIRVTIKVAGRWLKNSSVFNSHNLTPIPIGDGNINIISIALAAISQMPSNIIDKIAAGKYFLILFPQS